MIDFNSDNMRFDLPKSSDALIKVIGVGGGGSNAVNHMFRKGIKGVDFIVCNTDQQALDMSPVPTKIKLGQTLTGGKGAGSKPEIGREAAIENIEDLKTALGTNTNMVFITAGMGGGTGTGAAPVIANAIKEMGILTVGIVTIPFTFEGPKRKQYAETGLNELRAVVDTLLVIKNERIRELFRNVAIQQAFGHADEVLCTAAKGIAEIITQTGTINVDMNDVNTVMKDSGVAIMGSATASGEGRALTAATQALESPLLNDNEIFGAKKILLNITIGCEDVMLEEIMSITDLIYQRAGSEVDVIWGQATDYDLGADIAVTVIATGFGSSNVDTGLPPVAPQVKTVTLDLPETKSVQPLTDPFETVAKAPAEDEPFIIRDAAPESKEERSFTLFDNEEPATPASLRFVELPADNAPAPELPKSESEFNIFDLDSELPTSQASNDNPTNTLLFKENNDVQGAADQTRPSKDMVVAMNRERETRLREMSLRIKSASGLEEYEKQPAYMRQGVKLDESLSSDERVSPNKIVKVENDLSGNPVHTITENPYFGHKPD